MNGLKIGDVVRLKSGGPNMTVTKVGLGDTDSVMCQWLVDGSVKVHTFPPATLEIVDTERSTPQYFDTE